MKKRIWSSAIVIIVVTVMTALLGYFSMREKLDELTQQICTAELNLLKSKLEYIADYGSDLSKYYSTGQIIAGFRDSCLLLDEITLFDEDETLIYSTDDDYAGQAVNSLRGSGKQSVFIDGSFYAVSPVEAGETIVAQLCAISHCDKRSIIVTEYGRILMLVYAAGLCCQTLMYWVLYRKMQENFTSTVMFALFIAFMVLLSLLTFNSYEKNVNKYVYYCVDDLISVVEEDFDKLEDNGVDLSDIDGVELYLDKISSRVDALSSIDISQTKFGMKMKYNFKYAVSDSYMSEMKKDIFIDVFMLFIVAIFLHIEITNMSGLQKIDNECQAKISPEAVRAQSFMLFISYNLSSFYVPLRMIEILESSNITSQMATVLPTSAEAMAMSLAAILSGVLIDRRGWKIVFMSGNVVMMMGMLLSFLSFSPAAFTASRLICGAGYGACLNCIRTCAVYCGEDRLSSTIANINSASYACVNIGSVIGGFVGWFMGIRYAFAISAALTLAGYLFSGYKMNVVKQELTAAKKSAYVKLLLNGKLYAAIIMILLPVSFGAAFIDYFYSVYSSGSLGMKLTEISRGYLLNGLIFVFAGVSINKFLHRRLSSKGRIVASSLTMMSAIALFCLLHGESGMYASVAVMSAALTYAMGSFIEYYMTFDGMREIGFAKSMSLFTLFEKTGTYVAVLIYGAVLSGNIGTGMFLWAGIMFAMPVIYVLVSDRGRKKNENYAK